MIWKSNTLTVSTRASTTGPKETMFSSSKLSGGDPSMTWRGLPQKLKPKRLSKYNTTSMCSWHGSEKPKNAISSSESFSKKISTKRTLKQFWTSTSTKTMPFCSKKIIILAEMNTSTWCKRSTRDSFSKMAYQRTNSRALLLRATNPFPIPVGSPSLCVSITFTIASPRNWYRSSWNISPLLFVLKKPFVITCTIWMNTENRWK